MAPQFDGNPCDPCNPWFPALSSVRSFAARAANHERPENEERLTGPDARQTRQTREWDAGLNADRHRRHHAAGAFGVFRGPRSRTHPFRVFRGSPSQAVLFIHVAAWVRACRAVLMRRRLTRQRIGREEAQQAQDSGVLAGLRASLRQWTPPPSHARVGKRPSERGVRWRAGSSTQAGMRGRTIHGSPPQTPGRLSSRWQRRSSHGSDR
jgi:hypothetical protein